MGVQRTVAGHARAPYARLDLFPVRASGVFACPVCYYYRAHLLLVQCITVQYLSIGDAFVDVVCSTSQQQVRPWNRLKLRSKLKYTVRCP